MSDRVYIPDEGITGVIVSLMAYGAIVKYTVGGIEFYEMLAEEDYEIVTQGMTEGLSVVE